MTMLQTALHLLCSLLLVAGATEQRGSYIITAPERIQPGMAYDITVDILNATDVLIETTIEEELYNGVTNRYEYKHVQNASGIFNKDNPQTLSLPTDVDIKCSGCQIRIRGTRGLQFERVLRTPLSFQVAVIMVQTDKAIYKPAQTVRYRVFAVFSNLLFYSGAFTIEIRDPGSNIVKILTNATSLSGVVEDQFDLGEQTAFGTWSIGVTLADLSNVQQTQNFEVAEYELPLFEVTVELPPYALTTDEILSGTVNAKYTFGQPVKGLVELHVGPNEGPNQCGDLPRSTQISFAIDGQASFSIAKEDISRAVPIYNNQQVRVTAIVKEESTGVRLNGSSVVQWYSNKYQVKFTDNTPSVFKAGLPYTAFIQVTTPDNKPPTDTNITLSVYTVVTYQLTVDDQALYSVGHFSGTYPLPGQNVTLPASGLLAIDIDIPKNATSITVKASLKDVVASKTIEKMLSKSNNFIQLAVVETNIQSGSTVHIKVVGTEPLNEVVYEIVSRSSVVDSGTLDGKGERSFIAEFLVTPDFAPTAHLIMYYNRGTDEIIADSLAFNVEKIFNNNVTIDFSKNESEPNKGIKVKVSAEPGSEVFILVLDQSVLLLKSGNDITPGKVSESVSRFNTADKPSGNEFALSYGAANVQEVFNKIGLKLLTDIPPPEQPQRYGDYNNNWSTRPYSLLRGGSGYMASDIGLSSGHPNIGAFKQLAADSSILQQVEHVRSVFPETWVWEKTVTRENGTAVIKTKTPDTISSWVASCFAAHSTAGLGVAATTSILKVFRPFFVSLTYPSSIVRGEQCVIQAVVFNYLPTKLTVTVILKGSPKYLNVKHTGATNLELHESGEWVQIIEVESGKQEVAFFPILATKLGVADVQVTAQSSVAADGVRRQITIRPEGAPFSYNYPIFVNLEEAGNFKESVKFPLPNSTVTGSDNARVKVTGDLIGSSLDSLNSLLQMPSGCGEQSMAKFAPIVFIAQYLKATGQLTPAILKKIIGLLEAGYQRQLTYKRSDNGFSAFGNFDESASTWLTAFVSRVLFEAKEFIFVDDNVLINAVDWLIQRQNKDGSFNEFGKVLDASTQGTGSGPALTAFVLLSFIKNSPLSSRHCSEGVECFKTYEWGNATANAKRNLEELVDNNSINDQFTLSVVTYALTVADSSKAKVALTKLETFAHREGGLVFWIVNSTASANQVSNYLDWRPPHVQARPINIIVTSYAILSYVALGKLKEAFPVVQWLIKERNPSGGFASSQDTSVGLHALAAFATKSIRPDTDLNVLVSNNVTLAEFHIDKQNALVLQIKELAKAPPKVDIDVNGKGFAFVEIIFYLNILKELQSSSFDVSTVLLDDDIDSFNLMVCTKRLMEAESGMVVQEISIPSGFAPDLNSIGNVAGLKKSEKKGNTVNVYFDQISRTSICYSIRMIRTDKVAKTQENYVRTSAYYDPRNQATVFWQPTELRDSSICDVCDKCCK